MAAILSRLWIQVVRAPAASLRCFSVRSRRKKRVEYPEVREEWDQYRKDMSQLRKQFIREWEEKERMMQEAVSVQATEEARMERMMEQKNLEDNEKELAIMAEARAKLAQEKDAHMKDKCVRGRQEREKVEQFLEGEREKEVLKEAKETRHFISMETLDVAISYALENPVSYEFALKPNGEKIMTTADADRSDRS